MFDAFLVDLLQVFDVALASFPHALHLALVIRIVYVE